MRFVMQFIVCTLLTQSCIIWLWSTNFGDTMLKTLYHCTIKFDIHHSYTAESHLFFLLLSEFCILCALRYRYVVMMKKCAPHLKWSNIIAVI